LQRRGRALDDGVMGSQFPIGDTAEGVVAPAVVRGVAPACRKDGWVPDGESELAQEDVSE